MLLQVAIDRVDVETATAMVDRLHGLADIVEIGTSLIKDFGLRESVGKIKRRHPGQVLLADIKTIDEGEYEFSRAYEAGADIATVMGGSSMATISACRKVAREFGRDYMIDLLEVDADRRDRLREFDDAIFCVHLSTDAGADGLDAMLAEAGRAMSGSGRLAGAGGVTLGTLDGMRAAGFGIAVVGGAITKAADMALAASEFNQRAHKGDI